MSQNKWNQKRLGRLLKSLGPGIVTGASDDDPSGIATYAQAGAALGYSTLWTALVTYQRAEGELWEMVCAENPFEYYAGADAAIPTADRPDF